MLHEVHKVDSEERGRGKGMAKRGKNIVANENFNRFFF